MEHKVNNDMNISFASWSSPFLTSIRAAALMLAAALALSACGFHLRGSDGSYNLPFNKIYVGLPVSSPLAIDLKRNIRAIGTTEIADDAASADGIIDVLTAPGASRGKSILSLNTNGRVREYQLSYTIQFKVRDNVGNQLLGPTQITLTRPITFSETQLLAKETEEEMLYRNMQADLVQQMLRRLVALKPVVTSSPVPVADSATNSAVDAAAPATPAAAQ
jgi:LPS-assembly lipoprotein